MKQKRFLIQSMGAVMALSLFGLVACTPLIQPPAAAPDPGAGSQEEHPALVAARALLVQDLGVDADAITVVSDEEVLWPDACLGAPAADEMCAQVETPGYLLTLSVNGTAYLYHTNTDGTVVRPATEMMDETSAAMVERVTVNVLESDPVQVEVVIAGQLPDGCTTLHEATVAAEGNIFTITLPTSRPADQMCAQVLTPFEQVVSLGTPEAATGAYEVHVGDLVESFTLGE